MNSSTLLDLLSHTALKGAVVLLVALLLGMVLRRTAAARRYALWITAVATLAVLPMAMWVLPAWRVLPKAEVELEWPVMEPEPVSEIAAPVLPVEENNVSAPTAMPVTSRVAAQPSFSWNMTWQDVVGALPVVWMLLAGLLLLRLGHSAWRLHLLEASLRPGECALLDDAARELGLKRMPRLLIGPSDSVPMVWGVFKPRLLLPQGFETWSPEKQRGVLLHELAHLKRGDPLALWAAQWVKALHWFNPLVWLTLRQLRADQERACDDAVLRHGVRASDYAQSLLDLSLHNRLAPGLSLCALTITRCAPVEARVKAILDPTRRREGLTLRWLAGLAACALLITLPVAMLHAIEGGSALRGRILDRNGVVLAESTKEKVRVYPHKTLVAHVTGYTGRKSKDDDRPTGREGLELQHEATLRQGKDVSLSLDARVQALTTRAMTEAGFTSGAAMVLDPRTGEILAAVSLPAFDTNCFVPRVSTADFEAYSKDKHLPFFNRCFRGLYPPAAAFTPLTAMAGFSAGLGNEHYPCNGSISYDTRIFRCWQGGGTDGGHGTLDLKGAMVSSCNCYWYQFGNAAGPGPFLKLGTALGFDTDYGLLSHESVATLPTQADLEKRGRPWGQADTASLSIGQGRVLLTPLHLSVLAATVANGGKVPQPSLVKSAGTPAWHGDLAQQGVTAESMALLRQSMSAGVNDPVGTGKSAKSDKVVIAAKTGTLQWKTSSKQMLGLMIGFAPYDQPRLAFAVIYEGRQDEVVSGGKVCGPVVKRIVEETLALPADGSGEVKPVEDEIGRAHEKLQLTQARFDAQAAELTRDVDSIKKQVGEGLEVTKVTVAEGHLTIVGEAVDMPTALKVLHSLSQIGKAWVIEWNFPAPRALPEGKRVEFRAEGVCTAAAEQNALVPSKGKITTAMDADIILDPQLADRWRLLKKKGVLADLPAKAVIAKPGTWLAGASPFQFGASPFQFTAPREAAQVWLAGSLGDSIRKHYEKVQPWPEKPGAFDYTYEGFGDCMIHIKSLDAETVEVRLWLQSKGPNRILIAPDEAVPPTPKTDEPKEPSEVTANETPSMTDISQMNTGGEVSREIRHLAAKTGITLSEFINGAGKVSIVGLCEDFDDARMFGDLLTQCGKQWGIAWQLTTLRKVPDRPELKFMALGFYKTALMYQAPSVAAQPNVPPARPIIPAAGGVVPLLSNWQTLQRFGKLADLPAESAPDKIMQGEIMTGPMSSVVHAFTASRKAVQAWLSASLPASKLEAQADKLRELGGTEPFNHEFWGRDLCCIKVECAGEKARVLISRMSNLFRIAPDESQKPRPAGKLAPEYKQEGLTLAKPKVLSLEAAEPQLQPTISPEEAPQFKAMSLPPIRVQELPSPTRVKPVPASLQHLAGELSAESEKALLRSSKMNNRMRQSLIVGSPE
jgi:beta-lactamase regulating signal transducer with metallopeptidase domain